MLLLDNINVPTGVNSVDSNFVYSVNFVYSLTFLAISTISWHFTTFLYAFYAPERHSERISGGSQYKG